MILIIDDHDCHVWMFLMRTMEKNLEKRGEHGMGRTLEVDEYHWMIRNEELIVVDDLVSVLVLSEEMQQDEGEGHCSLH